MVDVGLAAVVAAVISVVAMLGQIVLKYFLDKGNKGGTAITVLVIGVITFSIFMGTLRYGENSGVTNITDIGKSSTEDIDDGDSRDTSTDTGDIEDINNGSDDSDASIDTENEDDTQTNSMSLIDLQPYTCTPPEGITGYPLRAESNIKDVFGNTYLTAIRAYSDRKYGERTMTYRIDGKYTSFKGTIAVGNGSQGAEGQATVIIYCDGDSTGHEYTFTSDMDSLPIEVDVTGVTDLKLEMYPGTGFSIYLCNPVLY